MLGICVGIAITIIGGKGIIDNIKNEIENPIISNTQLLIGYDKKHFIKYPIIIDMSITPHMFVCGLSGNGKTKMIEYAIHGYKVILVNVFKDDMRRIKSRRINGNDEILQFFSTLLKELEWQRIPLYIVIDEMMVLCNDSKISKVIMELLAIGRHYNIYIIGICQIGTKESVKYKDLFNSRVCFRQVEESSYRTVLGYSPEIKQLKKRQFYYYSNEIGKGYTYDI